MTAILNISEPVNVADKSRFQVKAASKWQPVYTKVDQMKSG